MDPLHIATSTSGETGGPDGQTQPPAGTPPANLSGDPSGPKDITVNELAYVTQLGKPLLDNKDALAKLAKHGRTIDSLADGWLKSQEKIAQLEGRTYYPTKDDAPEVWTEFYKKAGWPDAPTGYQFSRTGELEKAPQVPGLDEWTAQSYHKHRLTKEQGEGLFQDNLRKALELKAGFAAQHQAETAACTAEMEKRWGREAPARRVELEAVLVSYYGDAVAKKILSGPLGNDPDYLERTASIQKYLSNGKTVSGGPSGPQQPQTAGEAMKQALS